ncbi:TetR/AcrR family transcriptional regulator C-terminal domain-containing protein [Leifsonia sp. NPDC080035]|uniref:TetR/AcrR family transcriptional regulator C-terminal domain-containing protein n=1 Tax=Leifsonia sp. NPDC080035 TaxID=3143936 RepID=A0AAU7G881_9MICO
MADEVEEALPRAVALSWGVAERPQRGPKRELSIERIVDTAIGIADSDGLAAVSMSRIASDLGFTTMSLYRYVTSKDDVLALMQDAVCEIPIPAEGEEGEDWRAALRRWAMASIEVIQEHPWYPDIPISGIPLMPNNLAVLDWGLRAMRDLPLTDAEKMSTALLLSSYARAVGVVERDVGRSRGDQAPPQNGEAFTAALAELVTPERFPDLAPLVRSGTYADADGGDDQDDFAFGLERILDGIERYVSARAAGEPVTAFEERPEPIPNDKSVREAAKQRREAEKALREARKREREAIARARERVARGR